MPFHVNFLSYKSFTKKKTLDAASQGVTASFPFLPPKGRHELPREITPKNSPLGATGAKDDRYATRRFARVYAREKAQNRGGAKSPAAFTGNGEMEMHRIKKCKLISSYFDLDKR